MYFSTVAVLATTLTLTSVIAKPIANPISGEVSSGATSEARAFYDVVLIEREDENVMNAVWEEMGTEDDEGEGEDDNDEVDFERRDLANFGMSLAYRF